MPVSAPLSTELFRSIVPHKQGHYLLTLSKKTQERILSQLSDTEVTSLIVALDPSQATEVLRKIPDADARDRIMQSLNEEFRKKISFLFGFHPNSAGGLMDLHYIKVEKNTTLDEMKKKITQYEKKTGKIPTVIVVDEEKLLGEIPHRVFILSSSSRTAGIKKYIRPFPTLHHTETQDKVLETLRQSPHKKIVVLDDHENILGIIYSDDIIRVLDKEPSAGLYDFAGVHDEEDIFDPIRTKVKRRYKWLLINLLTAYLAAGVVSMFSDTLSQVVILAAYMPIVAGMGGNAATQTLAVTVRSLALGEIEFKNCFKALRNEVGAGMINGIINGLIVAGIAVVWNHSPMLGVVTGLAMVTNLIVAGFFGAFIPLVMQRLGKDPATSATIFITTATDVLGFLTFLGLATLLLI